MKLPLRWETSSKRQELFVIDADHELILSTWDATADEIDTLVKLANATQRLVNCPALNLDDLEPEDLAARDEARKLLEAAQ